MLLQHLPLLRKKTIILASQSPRRREILDLMTLPYIVQPSAFDENLDKSLFPSPDLYVIANAQGKALDVARTHPNYNLIIGSDTVVVRDGHILEKPKSETHAFDMLKSLSGRQHTVYTGVSLLVKGSSQPTNFFEATNVTFAHMTDQMIESYIKSGEPMDKAGAYGIQGKGGVFVSKIDGCFFTVMGLPMHALAREISRLIEDDLL